MATANPPLNSTTATITMLITCLDVAFRVAFFNVTLIWGRRGKASRKFIMIPPRPSPVLLKVQTPKGAPASFAAPSVNRRGLSVRLRFESLAERFNEVLSL